MVSHNPIIDPETLFDHRTNILATTKILDALWFGEVCLHHHLVSPRCSSVPGPHMSTQKPLLPPSIIRFPILFHVPIVLRPSLCCLLKSSCLPPPTHSACCSVATEWPGEGAQTDGDYLFFPCYKLLLHERSVSRDLETGMCS